MSTARTYYGGGGAVAQGRAAVSRFISRRERLNAAPGYNRISDRAHEFAPLYGATFTSSNTYTRRAAPRAVKRRAKRSFRSHVKNAMKLQNAQNKLGANTFLIASLAEQQAWGSFDILNGNTLLDIFRGQLPNNAPSVRLRDFKLFLKSFHLRMSITNTGSSTVLMDFYQVEPRFDIDRIDLAQPAYPTNGNTLAKWFYDHTQANTFSDVLSDTQGGVVPDSRAVAYTPFMFQNFCKMFRVTKIRQFQIPIGNTIVDNFKVGAVNLNPTRFITAAENTNVPTYPDKHYLKGISSAILVRFRGQSSASVGNLASQLRFSWEEQMCSKVFMTRPGSLSGNAQA